MVLEEHRDQLRLIHGDSLRHFFSSFPICLNERFYLYSIRIQHYHNLGEIVTGTSQVTVVPEIVPTAPLF
jgi:hypothetical protein